MKNFKEALLVVITVIAVVLSAGLFNVKEKEKAQKNEISLKLSVIRGSLSRLQDDIKARQKVKSEYDKKLEDLTKTASALEIEIEQIQKISDDAERQLAGIENEISSSRNATKNLLSEKAGLINKIASAESEGKDLENRLSALEEAKAALERHLKNMMRTQGLKETAASPRIQVQVKAESEEAAPEAVAESTPENRISNTAAASLEGEVLVANREFNFIVVNLGKKDGLKEGDRLIIYDADKALGEVSVETVRDNISAATGGKNLDAYRLRAGNRAIKS